MTAAVIAPALIAAAAAAAEVLPVHLIDNDAIAYGKPSNPGGGTPTQPAQSMPWGISQIGADDVWGHNTGSGILVAVLDTGIQGDHPDLAGKVVGGTRFFTRGISLFQDDKWGDDHGHGTHVAGTIGAHNNSIGVVGVAYDVEFLAVKVLDKSGSGSWQGVAAGIDWAVENGADVISMSLGGSGGSSVLATAVANAISAGVIVVAASGNSGDGSSTTTETSYPAAYNGVVAVGATDSSNNVASWSSSASYIDICGPGVGVLSTYKGSWYATMSGTSMATPHVAGTVALLLGTTPPAAYGSSWDSHEVSAHLSSNAMAIGAAANSCGGGLVDAGDF